MSKETIQRYDPIGCEWDMVEMESGDFVKFTDHQEAMAKQAQALAGAREALSNAFSLALAWTAHYATTYNGGVEHPVHRVILDSIEDALAGIERAE